MAPGCPSTPRRARPRRRARRRAPRAVPPRRPRRRTTPCPARAGTGRRSPRRRRLPPLPGRRAATGRRRASVADRARASSRRGPSATSRAPRTRQPGQGVGAHPPRRRRRTLDRARPAAVRGALAAAFGLEPPERVRVPPPRERLRHDRQQGAGRQVASELSETHGARVYARRAAARPDRARLAGYTRPARRPFTSPAAIALPAPLGDFTTREQHYRHVV